MSKPYYITEEGLEELKSELKELTTTKRKEISKRLQEAKSMGDLSENAEYIEAREAQAFVEGRIVELEDLIRRAVLIKKREGMGRVWIGSTITARSGLKQRVFTIVGSEEADPARGLISNESPLGQAFLGKEIGDEVAVRTPTGEVKYKIVDIK